MNRGGLRLGVNIDHVATLRQQRGASYPCIPDAARVCEQAGAEGITVHLREDRRHIQDDDVFALRKSVATRLNLEMANSPGILRIALKARPDEVCFVPERREELTTEGGLDVAGHQVSMRRTVKALKDAGIAVSLFVEPDVAQLDACAEVGAAFVELHTGAFCDASGQRAKKELTRLIEGARYAHRMGLKVNAGHGINMDNVGHILRIPFLDTLNIGHSIVCRAVFVGLRSAVKEMVQTMRWYRGGT
jgi:pyridoxine 5-phosphate synthase